MRAFFSLLFPSQFQLMKINSCLEIPLLTESGNNLHRRNLCDKKRHWGQCKLIDWCPQSVVFVQQQISRQEIDVFSNKKFCICQVSGAAVKRRSNLRDEQKHENESCVCSFCPTASDLAAFSFHRNDFPKKCLPSLHPLFRVNC